MLLGAHSQQPLCGPSKWEHNPRGALGCGADTTRACGLDGHSSVVTADSSPPLQMVRGAYRTCKKESVCHLPIQRLIPFIAGWSSDKSLCFLSTKPVTKSHSWTWPSLTWLQAGIEGCLQALCYTGRRKSSVFQSWAEL